MKKVIATSKAPAAIGPYSQGILAGGTLYISGQLGIDPSTGNFAGEGILEQSRQALINLGEILSAAGLGYENVVKTTIFVTEIDKFAQINEIYGEFFKGECPARSLIEATALPKNGKFEIEAVAYQG